MRLSVIIPIYGVERFIERCARSVMEQDYPDKEIIFVDDASPDASMTVLKRVLADYPEQEVTLLSHSQNRGLAAARQTGLEAAGGDYIVSLDSDDYLERNALTLLARKAEETGADMVGMDCWFEWNDNRSLYRGQWTEDAKAYSRLLLSGATLPGVCLHMIRRDLYRRTQLQPIEGLNSGEDYVLTPRLSWSANRIAHVEQPLYHYTQTNTGSIVHSPSETHIRQIVRVVEILTDFFGGKPECADALRAGQWLKKTDLMMRVARKDYVLADTMPAKLPVAVDTMSMPQRLAAPLVAHRRWTLLWLYSRSFNGLLELIQILKGRRKKC
ncbi:MAG: glycosyltransferase family 2 protein [Paludibacteraceae bacterium]|nr:glycosyltransferase family 2 protein [Paludibacteraceae bacterium]